MRPTRRLVRIALAGFVFALLPVLIQPQLWTFWPIFLAWLFVVCGIDALLAPRTSAVQCEIRLPGMLYMGMSDVGRLTIRTGTDRSVRLRLLVDVSAELEPPAAWSGHVRDGREEIEILLQPLRRGVARVEAVWLQYTGPLGLIERIVRIASSAEISVAPNVLPLRSAALRFYRDRQGRTGLKIERFEGDGTEFDSLKEFAVGEDKRGIDWKASARHCKLLTRQFRAERNHQVILAIDTGHLMIEPIERIPRLDHALNLSLLLSYVCLKSGDRVGLFTFDARVGLFVEPQGGMDSQARIAETTSRVEYSASETNFTLGLTSLGRRLRRRSLIIVLTDFVDTVTAELMVENLARLARRHLVLFVALRDPEPERIVSSRPHSPVALSRAVVADGFVREREVVLRRLRRLGVLPIDARPRDVSTELINRYLEVKRREMI